MSGCTGEVQGPNGVSYNPRSRKPKIDANGEKKARSPYIKVSLPSLSLSSLTRTMLMLRWVGPVESGRR